MQVPFMDLSRTYAPIQSNILDAVTAVLDSQRYIGGPVLTAFEEAIQSTLDVKHAIGVSSGTDALLVAMMALNIGPGDEVITTPFTFFATAGSILRLGATPVFVDIELETFNMDPALVEAAITPKTRAILPVHLFGQMMPMGELKSLARTYNLAIIEDSAQAIGAHGPDGIAGCVGDFGCLSFFPTKNLGCAGDGGMVLTNNDDLASQVRVLAKHGARPKYVHQMVGGNFRLDAIQAAILLQKLPHLESWNQMRRENAAWYNTHLDHEDIVLPSIQDGHTVTFHQYCVRVKDRNDIQAKLKAHGVQTMVYYPLALHEQTCLAYMGHQPQDFPNAHLATQEILALPVFPGLTQKERDHVVHALLSVV